MSSHHVPTTFHFLRPFSPPSLLYLLVFHSVRFYQCLSPIVFCVHARKCTVLKTNVVMFRALLVDKYAKRYVSRVPNRIPCLSRKMLPKNLEEKNWELKNFCTFISLLIFLSRPPPSSPLFSSSYYNCICLSDFSSYFIF